MSEHLMVYVVLDQFFPPFSEQEAVGWADDEIKGSRERQPLLKKPNTLFIL
jgi:hypothetical protein